MVNAIDSVQAARIRINRFEREGGNIDPIAAQIAERFKITAVDLKKRHRGNSVSDARKAFAFIADREYHAPHRIIAEYLNVGSTAVSEMSRKACRKVK